MWEDKDENEALGGGGEGRGEGRGGEGRGGEGRGGEGRGGEGRGGEGRGGEGRGGEGRAVTYPGSMTGLHYCEGRHQRADCRVCDPAPSTCSCLVPADSTQQSEHTYQCSKNQLTNQLIDQSINHSNY